MVIQTTEADTSLSLNGEVTQASIEAPGTLAVTGSLSASEGISLLATETLTVAANLANAEGTMQLQGTAIEQQGQLTASSESTITVTALDGSITMAAGSLTASDLGTIHYTASQELSFSQISSTGGAIILDVDAVETTVADELLNLATSDQLTILTNGDIGATEAIQLDVAHL